MTSKAIGSGDGARVDDVQNATNCTGAISPRGGER